MWVITLYDRNDRQIATYRLKNFRNFDAIVLSWALNHGDIEFIKITANKPA